MTPEELRSELLEHAESLEWNARHKRILNTPMPVVGVRMGPLRRIAKDICRGDWREFVSAEQETYEHCIVKALVIATADTNEDERLGLSRRFLREIRDWSVCDTFCGQWKRDRGSPSEALWEWCINLLSTEEEFPMRVGAVMMMSQFLDDDHIGDILGLLTAPRESPGYYWDMGCAWALSFCYIEYPGRTEKELFSGGLSEPILTMTVGKIRDSYRVPKESKARTKELLAEFRRQDALSRPSRRRGSRCRVLLPSSPGTSSRSPRPSPSGRGR